MKAPLFWLKDYVDIDCSTDELVAKLFSCGFEVEEISKICGKADKIVTCKILSISQHPNADKLSVTKVDAGKYGKLQIVTNAKNISVGDVVPVAVDGATLYSGDRIFAGELRGVKSQGMFCSGEELGITDDWQKGASFNGIFILDNNFPLGEEVSSLLEIDDVVLDINVTANRPDCQSILGLAREVAAVLNKPLKMPNLSYNCCEDISTKSVIKVSNNAIDLCPRYSAHLVKDIKVAESPLWIKRRLFAMGIRSISNVVDVTNFVLLEIGQPMHAFDLNDLSGNEIIVRKANNGEKITTLDEKNFELNSSNLVICDSEKPVALAGIMGGLNSGIKDSTLDIVFESAKFARDNIRKTSRVFGQRSDSSSRFEKGVDAWSTEIGLKRALNLIDTLKIGKIAKDGYDLVYCDVNNKVIKTTLSKVNEVLGINIDKETVKDILTRLSFEVSINGDELTVVVPLFRDDMEDYPDVAEEIIREYGYDNITPTLLKTSAITMGGRNEIQSKTETLKNLLTGYGFNEIISYSFVSEKEFDLFGLKNIDKAVKIINPIGEDLAVMRTSLLPSIVRTVAYNLNRKNYSGRLFELAKIYSSDEIPLKELPEEKVVLSLSTFGAEEDYFTLKGVVEGVLDQLCNGINVKYVRSNKDCMHPTCSADLYLNGEFAGYFGQINPEIASKMGIDKPVFGGEIYFNVLAKNFNDKIVFDSISKYPTIERDLAIILDENVSYDKVFDTIKASGGDYLKNVALFDIYRGNQIAENKKSMAFNLLFESKERTLNLEEIDASIKNILLKLKTDLGAELR